MRQYSQATARIRHAVVAAALAAALLAGTHVHVHAAPAAAPDACALCRVAHAPVLLAAPPVLPLPVVQFLPDEKAPHCPVSPRQPRPAARGPPMPA